jgi:hypothetical protein
MTSIIKMYEDIENLPAASRSGCIDYNDAEKGLGNQ